ncbi:MAG: hypothetical protein HQL40_20035 [Alphaproteobacteria bacterium]|nr:hypothetical protein [Alphaproteobacteria bacterium]
MPIRYEKTTAHFEGACLPDEALALIEWLNVRKSPKVDLRACEHLHAALLQVLLAARPRIVEPPADPFLARWAMPR